MSRSINESRRHIPVRKHVIRRTDRKNRSTDVWSWRRDHKRREKRRKTIVLRQTGYSPGPPVCRPVIYGDVPFVGVVRGWRNGRFQLTTRQRWWRRQRRPTSSHRNQFLHAEYFSPDNSQRPVLSKSVKRFRKRWVEMSPLFRYCGRRFVRQLLVGLLLYKPRWLCRLSGTAQAAHSKITWQRLSASADPTVKSPF